MPTSPISISVEVLRCPFCDTNHTILRREIVSFKNRENNCKLRQIRTHWRNE